MKASIKINFLRECSVARSMLDQSIVLSTAALAPNEQVDLKQSAALQIRAQEALQKAHEIALSNDPSAPALAAAHKMMDSIRSAIRRQRVDLLGHACAAWQHYVSLTLHNLTVRTTGDIAEVYDVLEQLEEDGDATS